MIRVRLALVLVALAGAALAGISVAAPAPRVTEEFLNRQVVVVNDICTGTVIAPTRVLTASHCVGVEGATAEVRSGPVTGPAVVAWDSIFHARASDRARRGLDLAVLTLRRPWPYSVREVCIDRRPVRGETYVSRSFSMGQEWWTVSPVLRVVAIDVDLGEVAVWSSDQLPGSSGSLIFSTRTGCGVGIVTHGVLLRGLVMGAVGWRLQEAVHGR